MATAVSKREFERFYGKHLDKIFRFVFFRVGGKKEQTEDLVSEIFLKALEHFESYDKTKSSSAWIMTIAKNHLANFWRDSKPTQPLPDDAGEEERPSDGIWLSSALREWRKDDSRREAYELLEKLPAEERELVTFHYLFGYSYAEIGELKGASEGAVKVAAHRGIKKLRELV